MTTLNDADFHAALTWDLDHEGRLYESIQGDPGGPTKYGVTWRDYNAYRLAHGKPALTDPTQVKTMTIDEIEAIYREHYWEPVKGAILPSPLDLVLFDAAVNVGVSRSIGWLQAVIGVAQTGRFDNDTQAATTRYLQVHHQATLCDTLLDRRTAYYQSRGPWADKFKRGWLSRVADLRTTCRKTLS